MDELKPGTIVEYLNSDDDFKLAIITENVAGIYYDAITFTSRKIYLGVPGKKSLLHMAGVVRSVLAHSLAEYLSAQRI